MVQRFFNLFCFLSFVVVYWFLTLAVSQKSPESEHRRISPEARRQTRQPRIRGHLEKECHRWYTTPVRQPAVCLHGDSESRSILRHSLMYTGTFFLTGPGELQVTSITPLMHSV